MGKSETLSAERVRELEAFCRHSEICLKSLPLLNLAFCHRSYVNEAEEAISNNERLEFLGDSVLGLVVANYLYRKFSSSSEGDLAKIKSYVVSEKCLLGVAEKLNLSHYLLMGRGEDASGGRQKKTLLTDCLEAVIAVIFIDVGYREAEAFILRQLAPIIDYVAEKGDFSDYKTLLQEYCQQNFKKYPEYALEKREGPDHNTIFWVSVKVIDQKFGPCSGQSKKEAEQSVAKEAYLKFTQSVGKL